MDCCLKVVILLLDRLKHVARILALEMYRHPAIEKKICFFRVFSNKTNILQLQNGRPYNIYKLQKLYHNL
jgi:hypothetical protein